MSLPIVNAFQAVQNAQNALQRGDKLSARRWAEVAASLSPEREEPWLLLAAVASPQASVGYLKQALKINPNSPRAKAGMNWALKRVEIAAQSAETTRATVTKPVETIAQTATTATVQIPKPDETTAQSATTAPVRVAKPTPPLKPASLPENAKKSPGSPLFILLPILLIAILALSIWNASPVLAVFSSQFTAPDSDHAPAWAQVGLVKPTSTQVPTATSTPTATPIITGATTTSANPPVALVPTLTETPAASQTLDASPVAEASQTPDTSSGAEASPTPLPTDTAAPAQSNQQPAEAAPANFGGKWILVDISEQHMYAYEGETLVYSFVASTGMNSSTRVGTFHIQDKIPNAYGSTWNIWMPNWMGIYYSGSLENGIHALPILSNGATLWAGFLGTPISYGCVVLGSYESQQLYDWAEIGIPVKIQR